MTFKVGNEQSSLMPDTEFVSKVIAERFPQFISALLGTSEKLSEFIQSDVIIDKEDGIFWLEFAIEKHDFIKKLNKWSSDHFLSYLMAVLSWFRNPCSEFEDIYAMLALWRILVLTNPNNDLQTISSQGLMAILEEILEDTLKMEKLFYSRNV